MPLIPLLAVAFIVLKLLGIITWSWWLVLLPVYVPVILWVTFVGGYLTIMWHLIFKR